MTDVDLPDPGGVAGVARFGDPLVSLADEAWPIRDVLGSLAQHLRRATLVGHPAPVVERIADRLAEPQPGERVVVLDSINHSDPDTRVRGMGYLVLRRREWCTTTAAWERQVANGELYPDDPRPVERAAWYVQYGPHPADVCRWVNCDVMALPGPGDRWDKP